MKGVNAKLNYNQSATECRDKLVDLCNKWEMDGSEKDTMTLEVDDCFMSTIYSVVKILGKTDTNDEILDKLVDEMKSRYFHMVGTQFDNAILEMEKITEKLKK